MSGLRSGKTVHVIKEASGVLWRCQTEVHRLRCRAAGAVGRGGLSILSQAGCCPKGAVTGSPDASGT